MSIDIRRLTKHFGSVPVCDGLDLSVASGEMVALLGPSGSGKTTLLRIIAGLDAPDSGAVQLHGRDALALSARERGVGFVFQHYALFGHLTVFENVAFGLRIRPRATRPSEAVIRAKVDELLERVELAAFAPRYPHQLSGGQRQRVALARALSVEPKVLLLDEPFGALDARVRLLMRRGLRRLHEAMRITCIFVTHDQQEAMEVADRIVIMHRGRIEQSGSPQAIHDQPATPFVLQFLGQASPYPVAAENAAEAFVRPADVEVLTQAGPDTIPATLRHALVIGAAARLEFERLDGGEVIDVEIERETWCELSTRLAIGPGAKLHLRARRLMTFDRPATPSEVEALADR